MIKTHSSYFSLFKKYVLSIFVMLSILNCSPEDLTDVDDTNITDTEQGINTDLEDPLTGEPITEEPSINVPEVEMPVMEEPINEVPTTEEPIINEPTDEVVEENLTEAEALLILVNQSRADEGLSSLILNNALNQAALAHSTDMETNDYFSHEGLDGSRFGERTEDAGYTGSALGENIALGQRDIEAVHNAWMNSDGHRENILNPNITEMGLGHSGAYWTQIFGKTR